MLWKCSGQKKLLVNQERRKLKILLSNLLIYEVSFHWSQFMIMVYFQHRKINNVYPYRNSLSRLNRYRHFPIFFHHSFFLKWYTVGTITFPRFLFSSKGNSFPKIKKYHAYTFLTSNTHVYIHTHKKVY